VGQVERWGAGYVHSCVPQAACVHKGVCIGSGAQGLAQATSCMETMWGCLLGANYVPVGQGGEAW
jgi:hypothetical protein